MFFISDLEELGDVVTNSIDFPVNTDNEGVTLSEMHFAELQKTIQYLKAQLEQRDLTCLLAKQVCCYIQASE